MLDGGAFKALKRVMVESPRISRLIRELDATSAEEMDSKEGGLHVIKPTSDHLPSRPQQEPPHTTKLFGDVMVTCRKCADRGAEEHARGFVQAPPLSVVLCSNRLDNEAEIEELLLHELIHLYDLRVKKVRRC